MACTNLGNAGNYSHHTSREQPAFVQEIRRAQQPVSGIFLQNHSVSTRGVGCTVPEGPQGFMFLLVTRNRLLDLFFLTNIGIFSEE